MVASESVSAVSSGKEVVDTITAQREPVVRYGYQHQIACVDRGPCRAEKRERVLDMTAESLWNLFVEAV